MNLVHPTNPATAHTIHPTRPAHLALRDAPPHVLLDGHRRRGACRLGRCALRRAPPHLGLVQESPALLVHAHPGLNDDGTLVAAWQEVGWGEGGV